MAAARVNHLFAVLVVATCGCLLAAAGVATAQPAQIIVGPKQHFVAEVNGKSHSATIAVVCNPPLQAGKKGNPLGGQTIGVALSPGAHGYTGSAGTSIVARFSGESVVFGEYETQAIPSSPALPCEGTGAVVFSPQPTSATARSTTVGATYAAVLLLTQTDSGKTYRLHTGGGLDVQLTGPSDVTWTEPVSSNPAVLQQTGGSSGTTATATFAAIAKGKAQVTATGTFPCSQVCAQPILEFEVDVSVAA